MSQLISNAYHLHLVSTQQIRSYDIVQQGLGPKVEFLILKLLRGKFNDFITGKHQKINTLDYNLIEDSIPQLQSKHIIHIQVS